MDINSKQSPVSTSNVAPLQAVRGEWESHILAGGGEIVAELDLGERSGRTTLEDTTVVLKDKDNKYHLHRYFGISRVNCSVDCQGVDADTLIRKLLGDGS